MAVEPVTAPPIGRFPPRSSSYRPYSIIDAYGGDPGIQFSPVEEEIPTAPPPQTVLNSVRKQLRTEDVMSSYYNFDIDETYGSSYGSDPERLTMAMEDDYDPYRQSEPVLAPRSKIETGELSKKHVKTLPSRPDEGIVKSKLNTPAADKELPRPPVSSAVLERWQDRDVGRDLKTSQRVERRGLMKGTHCFIYLAFSFVAGFPFRLFVRTRISTPCQDGVSLYRQFSFSRVLVHQKACQLRQ